jgi:hypothetical protein
MRIRHVRATNQNTPDRHAHSKRPATKEQFNIAKMLSWSMLLIIPLVLFFAWKKADELSPTQALRKRHLEISKLVINTLKTSANIAQINEKHLPKWDPRFESPKGLQPNEIFIGSNGTELIGIQQEVSGDTVLKRIEFITSVKTKDNEKAHILNDSGTLVGTSEFQSATTEEIKNHPAFAIAQRTTTNTPFTVTEAKDHEGNIHEIGISHVPNTNLIVLTETNKSTFIDYSKKLKTIFLTCFSCLIIIAIITLRAWKNATRFLLERSEQAQFSKMKMQNFVLYLAKNSRNTLHAQNVTEAISNLANAALHGGIIKDVTGLLVVLPSQFLDPLQADQTQIKFHFERTLDGKIEIVTSNDFQTVTEQNENTGPQTQLLSGDCMFMRLKVSGYDQGFLICSRESFSDEFRHNMDLGLLLMRALSSQLEISLEQLKPEAPFASSIIAA